MMGQDSSYQPGGTAPEYRQAGITEEAGGQATQPWTHPEPAPYKPSHRFGLAKLVLGGFNLVFAILTLGLGLGLSFVGNAYMFRASLVSVLMMIAAAISIIWQAAEFLTRILRRRTHRPIHPGAHVGVHLLLWLLGALCVPSLAVVLRLSLADYTIGPDGGCNDYDDPNSPYTYQCNLSSYENFATQSDASRYFGLLGAMVCFASAMSVGHFVLFVMACVETTWRRHHGRRQRTKVVYVVGPPPTAGGHGGDDNKGYYAAVPGPGPHPALMSRSSLGVSAAGPPAGVETTAPAPTRFSMSTS